MKCADCSYESETLHGIKIHMAKFHDYHGEKLAKKINETRRKTKVECAACDSKIVPILTRPDVRQLTRGEHTGKYLCVSCSVDDIP